MLLWMYQVMFSFLGCMEFQIRLTLMLSSARTLSMSTISLLRRSNFSSLTSLFELTDLEIRNQRELHTFGFLYTPLEFHANPCISSRASPYYRGLTVVMSPGPGDSVDTPPLLQCASLESSISFASSQSNSDGRKLISSNGTTSTPSLGYEDEDDDSGAESWTDTCWFLS